MSSELTVIVARASNGVIGHQNAMPWHLPEELRHFKASTMGGILIMGRKTFDSIGRPLPGRRFIVITRNPEWHFDGVRSATSLDHALLIAEQWQKGSADRDADGTCNPGLSRVFVAGGAQIYRDAMAKADRLLVTQILLSPEGDAFFNMPDPTEWTRSREQKERSSNGTDYCIEEWRRNTEK